jgi:hypothetical protein
MSHNGWRKAEGVELTMELDPMPTGGFERKPECQRLCVEREEIESDGTEGNVCAFVCINKGILVSVCLLWQSTVGGVYGREEDKFKVQSRSKAVPKTLRYWCGVVEGSYVERFELRGDGKKV